MWGEYSKNASLEKFIASSNEDYINKAVYYANNIDELEKVRKNLFDNIEKSRFLIQNNLQMIL